MTQNFAYFLPNIVSKHLLQIQLNNFIQDPFYTPSKVLSSYLLRGWSKFIRVFVIRFQMVPEGDRFMIKTFLKNRVDYFHLLIFSSLKMVDDIYWHTSTSFFFFIGLFGQLFDIPIGQQTKPCVQVYR